MFQFIALELDVAVVVTIVAHLLINFMTIKQGVSQSSLPHSNYNSSDRYKYRFSITQIIVKQIFTCSKIQYTDKSQKQNFLYNLSANV